MDLDGCREKGFIKRTKRNCELVKSLIDMSGIKEKTVNNAPIDEDNICAYLPMAYDSLREIMEAICILHSYKVTSHICLGRLVKTLVEDFDYYRFDRFRYMRNSINYYGEKTDFNQGKEMIRKIFEMKNLLLGNINFEENNV